MLKKKYDIKDLESDEEFSESEFQSSDEEDDENKENDNVKLDLQEFKSPEHC